MNMPAEQLPNSMSLADLLQGIAEAPPTIITGISSDSRKIKPGELFLACGGERSHGLDYLDQVVAAGAAAVAYDSTTTGQRPCAASIPLVPVPGLADHLGSIANRYFHSPSESIGVVGITGTNGKTTVAWLLRQCLSRIGKPCGYIGTLGTGLETVSASDGMTTPDTLALQARLAAFRDAGAEYATVEVSSHALSQGRVAGVNFDAVMFTNLSRDHLDYHHDMRSYAEAKARLFTTFATQHRIINLDTEFGFELAARCGQDVITVSTNFDRVANGRRSVFVRSVVAGPEGSMIRITSSWGDGEFMLPLPGDFNVANAVLVLAFLLAKHVPLKQAIGLLAEVEAPPGRMQLVTPVAGRPAVYVDYAHTPEALDLALRALRAHCPGQVWCVFGCGGDRDPGKRPQMGRIAERRAARVVVTSDNPRDEAPDAIITAILGGMTHPDRATAIEDRAAAINWAIRQAGAGDCVLIAGKGHESHQLIGAKRVDMSDYVLAQASLQALSGMEQ